METSVVGRATVSATASVDRGLNDLRLAVLGILLSIALTIAFGVPGPWWAQLGAGVAAFCGSAGLIRWRLSRHWMMELMHRLTGG
jgi:hypothetical protein